MKRISVAWKKVFEGEVPEIRRWLLLQRKWLRRKKSAGFEWQRSQMHLPIVCMGLFVRPSNVVVPLLLMPGLGIAFEGYRHTIINISKRKEDASDLLPGVHRIASLLKRWLMGTHQGAVSHDHLDYYLDEFTFRFNTRTSSFRGKIFYRLLEQSIQVKPIPYKAIVKNIRGLKPEKHHQ